MISCHGDQAGAKGCGKALCRNAAGARQRLLLLSVGADRRRRLQLGKRRRASPLPHPFTTCYIGLNTPLQPWLNLLPALVLSLSPKPGMAVWQCLVFDRSWHRAAHRPGHPFPNRSGLNVMETDYTTAIAVVTLITAVLSAMTIYVLSRPTDLAKRVE